MAAAAELIHSATLLHDDVIDEGEERRNRPAARVLWGNLVSVLSGDLLLTRALQLVDGAGGARRPCTTCSRTLERLIGGEVAQLHARERDRSRRARATSTSCAARPPRCSASLAAAVRAWRKRDDLVEIGGQLRRARSGVAFQVVDDVLDLAGDPARGRQAARRRPGRGQDHAAAGAGARSATRMVELGALAARARARATAMQRVPSARTRWFVRLASRRVRIAAQHSSAALAALDALPSARARDLLRELSLVLTRRSA